MARTIAMNIVDHLLQRGVTFSATVPRPTNADAVARLARRDRSAGPTTTQILDELGASRR